MPILRIPILVYAGENTNRGMYHRRAAICFLLTVSSISPIKGLQTLQSKCAGISSSLRRTAAFASFVSAELHSPRCRIFRFSFCCRFLTSKRVLLYQVNKCRRGRTAQKTFCRPEGPNHMQISLHLYLTHHATSKYAPRTAPAVSNTPGMAKIRTLGSTLGFEGVWCPQGLTKACWSHRRFNLKLE